MAILKRKYVRLDDNELRFCKFEEKHSSLVKLGEKAVSAGLIIEGNDFFTLMDRGSVTLCIPSIMWRTDDIMLLESYLEKKHVWKERL